jgi:hypothetical protein
MNILGGSRPAAAFGISHDEMRETKSPNGEFRQYRE